jgi:LPXTG-motif cell wall-anchored protein
MMNTFGNNVTVSVDCPVQKQIVETVTDQLPHTGPTENMIVAGIALAVVAFFYARARQLKTEVRLIRRDFNTGTF